MKLNLENKKVLITGSTRGIGLDIAKNFINEGAIVGINSRNSKDIKTTIKELGSKNLYAIRGDVSKYNEIKDIYKNFKKNVGLADILICNVGSGKSVTSGTETFQEWQRVFEINLWSTINTINFFKKDLIKTKGSIVCISSICGHEYIEGAPITYSIAKNAINTYIKLASKELGKFKIRINGVSPGNILFDGSTWSNKIKKNEKQTKNFIKKEVSLNKFGEPKNISDIVLFLSSDKSDFTTGSINIVDGGQIRGI